MVFFSKKNKNEVQLYGFGVKSNFIFTSIFFFFCLLTVVICQNIVYFHCYQYLAKHLFQMFLMRHNAPETKLHQGNLFYVNLAVFESRNPCECSMDCPALENPHKVNLTSWKLSMYRRYGLSDILRIVKFC
jgi:hypothetical protein